MIRRTLTRKVQRTGLSRFAHGDPNSVKARRTMKIALALAISVSVAGGLALLSITPTKGESLP